jgi:hypothetical protein
LRTATIAGGCGIQGLVQNPANGAGATATLSAAPEAAVNLPGRARPRFGLDDRADVMVAQNIAGADDHMVPRSNLSILDRSDAGKRKTQIL